MAELISASLRLVFLGLTWLFIAFAANVIRTDIWGRRVATTSPEVASAPVVEKPRKRKRNAMTRLVITQGLQAGLRVPLDGVLSIGRASDAVVVIDDDFASAQHAQLFEDESGTWMIEDLHSTNGTYVNEARIQAPTAVGANDTVRIGRTFIRLER